MKWCGFVPVVRPCSANTQQVFACHCEERSDGTIRIPRRERGTLHPCPGVRTPTRPVIARSEATWQSVSPAAAHNEKQHLGRIRSSLRIRLKCYFSLPSSAGMRIATPVCALVRNDMLKEGRVRGCKDAFRQHPGNAPKLCKHAASLWMSLRGAKRRGNPYSLRQRKTKSSTLGESEKRYEFALRITNLQSFSAGMRIATPVCALVRNDMQKEGRVRGCKDVVRNDMQKEGRVRGCKDAFRQHPGNAPKLCKHAASLWMSLRGAKRRGNPFSLQ